MCSYDRINRIQSDSRRTFLFITTEASDIRIIPFRGKLRISLSKSAPTHFHKKRRYTTKMDLYLAQLRHVYGAQSIEIVCDSATSIIITAEDDVTAKFAAVMVLASYQPPTRPKLSRWESAPLSMSSSATSISVDSIPLVPRRGVIQKTSSGQDLMPRRPSRSSDVALLVAAVAAAAPITRRSLASSIEGKIQERKLHEAARQAPYL
jgi:hypothetical protein